ncbi:uncharacterized protein LOC144710709 [Wolffia australiana]
MASASSTATVYGHGEEEIADQMNQLISTPDPPPTVASALLSSPPQKRRRNQPGRPNPDAEVIALSPKTLMATNRFVCEVCNKGFQRDQNLRLHRRGHNLPWSLRQKDSGEAKQRVYLCPEPTCVHHDPSRALGDLTGIKKHYFRKHGEKKWKCDKCSKKYAVLSDLKAHSKTCGTREYRCGCGTVFSRRDSFITHRAFCDALAQESAHVYGTNSGISLGLSQIISAEDLTTSSLFPSEQPSGSSSSSFSRILPSFRGLPQPLHGVAQLPLPPYFNASSSSASLFDLSFFSNGGSDQSSFPITQVSEKGAVSGIGQPAMANAHDARLRNLMSSLAEGNVGVGLDRGADECEPFRRVSGKQGFSQMDGHDSATGFTRDFLGVGGMLRGVGSERDQIGGVDFLPFDSELTSPPTGRPFPGSGWR